MATIKNKFGTLTGWNNIKVHLLGRDLEGISEVAYDDEREMENVYGAGGYPVGQGEGNYAANASITLLNEERLALMASLPSGTRIQDIKPFPIVVEFEYQGNIYTDVIQNCRFKNNGVEAKQNDKSFSMKFDLLTSHIDWNV